MNCHIIFSHYGHSNIFFPKNSIIFNEGGIIPGIHFLQSGHVHLIKTDESGKEIVIKEVTEGEMIGHRCFFNRRVYGTTAIAQEDTLISFLNKELLHHLIMNDPEISHTLLRAFGEDLAEADNKTCTLMRFIEESGYSPESVLVDAEQRNYQIDSLPQISHELQQ